MEEAGQSFNNSRGIGRIFFLLDSVLKRLIDVLLPIILITIILSHPQNEIRRRKVTKLPSQNLIQLLFRIG